jgi:transposase
MELLNRSYRCRMDVFKTHIPPPNKRRRPRVHTTREVLNAVFYVLKSDCPWRLLPCKLRTPWETVYFWFRRWRIDRTWAQLNAALRQQLRIRLGRNARPNVGIVDSQSARTTGVGSEHRGYDGGKKIRGILSVISWWIRKGWYRRPRPTARRLPPGWLEATAGLSVHGGAWTEASVVGCGLRGQR